MYKRNIQARSRNHCCRRKAISITYSERVSVALGIHHAMRMRHVVFKSKYQSRLTNGHLKHCLHLCLNNYEPSFNRISQDERRRASFLLQEGQFNCGKLSSFEKVTSSK